MVFLRLDCLCVCLFLFMASVSGDVDEDYFFGQSSLVSLRTNDCGNKALDLLCQLSCSKYHVCLNQQCLCVEILNNEDEAKLVARTRDGSEWVDLDENLPGFIDLTKVTERQEDYSPKPALRHHIAHFCPNLDDARTCIRKCMKEGKAAFCGKDHVCYCGHKYNEKTKDEGGESKAIYAQFKDLYKKYFGDSYHPEGFYGEDD